MLLVIGFLGGSSSTRRAIRTALSDGSRATLAIRSRHQHHWRHLAEMRTIYPGWSRHVPPQQRHRELLGSEADHLALDRSEVNPNASESRRWLPQRAWVAGGGLEGWLAGASGLVIQPAGEPVVRDRSSRGRRDRDGAGDGDRDHRRGVAGSLQRHHGRGAAVRGLPQED